MLRFSANGTIERHRVSYSWAFQKHLFLARRKLLQRDTVFEALTGGLAAGFLAGLLESLGHSYRCESDVSLGSPTNSQPGRRQEQVHAFAANLSP